MRILITAGATHNQVDAIRYLSAHATGTTGVTLATRLASPDREVDFLGSAEACLRLPEEPIAFVEEFMGTRDLMERMERLVPHADVVIHSAAVGDYEVESDFGNGKIPSGKEGLTLRLVPAPKILDHIRSWNPTCFLLSFKAAPPGTSFEELKLIARAQLRRTGSDVVFANVIGETEYAALISENESWFDARDVLLDEVVRRVRSVQP